MTSVNYDFISNQTNIQCYKKWSKFSHYGVNIDITDKILNSIVGFKKVVKIDEKIVWNFLNIYSVCLTNVFLYVLFVILALETENWDCEPISVKWMCVNRRKSLNKGVAQRTHQRTNLVSAFWFSTSKFGKHLKCIFLFPCQSVD